MLNGTEQQLLMALTKADLELIEEELRPILIGGNSLIRKGVYNLVKNKLSNKLNEQDFCQALSLNIKTKRLAGFKITRGKHGGVAIDDSPNDNSDKDDKATADYLKNSTEYKSPLRQETVRAVSNSRSRHVWIDRRLFRVTTTFGELEKIILVVLRGKEEKDGRITFNGKQYNCSDVDVFERYINVMMGAVPEGESDPVLDDGSGVPVELRVA